MSEGNHDHEPKGTNVIISIFFMVLVVYYFMNWKFLSELWKVG